jgi:hypothetical protein
VSEQEAERETMDGTHSADEPTPKDADNATSSDVDAPRDLDGAQARLAYSIIGTLLEHTRITGDLIALMAQALDEDTLKALTNTPYWAAYLDSRRAMERASADMDKFARVMTALGGEDA